MKIVIVWITHLIICLLKISMIYLQAFFNAICYEKSVDGQFACQVW